MVLLYISICPLINRSSFATSLAALNVLLKCNIYEDIYKKNNDEIKTTQTSIMLIPFCLFIPFLQYQLSTS
ncbi:hypothetical protein ELX74_24910 [Escherichia coli]|nr:hypothetical protein CI719_24055 [Shigella boydii]TFL34899.1 hypothetical protein ELY49_27420 [Escherichia coli]TFL46099.1 hypothetical protein ELY35_30085 [Escherichia coli]TFL48348.1 hypothetical protein ELY35_27745 [Escherichia coli]TFL59891.1 hypothetical protein ELY41_26945 [Escherichia coli]